MNEKIKQLAEQAGIYNLELTDETEYWILEKFAQLIVKECASVALMSNGNNLYVCELIKEHFGVEE
jgi:hypothetical protein